ncbi:hypothetical protein QLL95_gp0742 [Cotonvirus japonicus]|uniref:Uncharacterized protein n=1 Tax=Cotonvirus japonicus TaxID=2811091 RepID=A0ABM7NTF6_9VIRU|nr:hypothetical protein QLL95_gp0742 [Cotonvirus japonicus]BCS83381.1 hypothetical protein [Cotonvirus japonicus]
MKLKLFDNLNIIIFVMILILFFIIHCDMLSVSSSKLYKLLVITSLPIFIMIIYKHYALTEIDKKYETDDYLYRRIKRKNIINYDNNAIKLLSELCKHPNFFFLL